MKMMVVEGLWNVEMVTWEVVNWSLFRGTTRQELKRKVSYRNEMIIASDTQVVWIFSLILCRDGEEKLEDSRWSADMSWRIICFFFFFLFTIFNQHLRWEEDGLWGMEMQKPPL